jgi:hypothetical protein
LKQIDPFSNISAPQKSSGPMVLNTQKKPIIGDPFAEITSF